VTSERTNERRMSAGWRGLALTLVMCLATIGCGEEESAPLDIVFDPAEVEMLEMLGYVDFGEADEGRSGVTQIDRARSSTGFDLVTYPVLRRAELIDTDGDVVHAWTTDLEGTHFERASILANGDLLVLNRPRGLLRLAPDGHLRWELRDRLHHHNQELPDGRIVGLTSRTRKIGGFSNRNVVDNGVALLSADGELLEETSLYDAFERSQSAPALEEPSRPESPGRPLDLFHVNRLHWLTEQTSDLMRPDRVLLTVRHQDLVVLLDWASREIIWSWGRGILVGPHDAQVLENGHVLIFDNEGLGDASRILEVDPESDEIVWSYVAPTPQDFHSNSRGTVQRLPGGTTLIGESNRGRAFEVTPEGEIVWEYRTPHRDSKQRPAALRIERYSKAFVAPILDEETTR
jgi:hypothetical protein